VRRSQGGGAIANNKVCKLEYLPILKGETFAGLVLGTTAESNKKDGAVPRISPNGWRHRGPGRTEGQHSAALPTGQVAVRP